MGTLLTGSDLRSDSNCLIKKCIVEGFTLCIDGAVKGMKLESQLPGEDFSMLTATVSTLIHTFHDDICLNSFLLKQHH